MALHKIKKIKTFPVPRRDYAFSSRLLIGPKQRRTVKFAFDNLAEKPGVSLVPFLKNQGRVARSMVSANHGLSCIKTYRSFSVT